VNEIDLIRKKFESYIQPTNKCWHWIGPIDKNSGRGKFKVNGKSRNVCVVAWELSTRAKLPAGMVVKQICENSLCVNPSHLETHRRTFPGRT
jgi:hypothetical protein